MTLVLNGDWPTASSQASAGPRGEPLSGTIPERGGYLPRAVDVWRDEGTVGFLKRAAASFYWRVIYRPQSSIDKWISRATRQPGKKVLKTHLSRADTIQAFLTADLFVFASRIEYSPLVLFEAAAAGTPFISVPVGNAEEIARWTGGGVICPATRNELGYTNVSPRRLAKDIGRLVADRGLRDELGRRGREAWKARFNWKVIADVYERILTGRTSELSMGPKDEWALGR
jgi:glycosyltransferase involved in cell wall biosynthesis